MVVKAVVMTIDEVLAEGDGWSLGMDGERGNILVVLTVINSFVLLPLGSCIFRGDKRSGFL